MNTRQVSNCIIFFTTFIVYASTRPTTPLDDEPNWVIPPIDWNSAPREFLEKIKPFVPNYDEPDDGGPGETYAQVERRFHPERFQPGGIHYKALKLNETSVSHFNESRAQPNQTSNATDPGSVHETKSLIPDKSAATERREDEAQLTPTTITLFGLLGVMTLVLVFVVSYRSAFKRKYKLASFEPASLEMIKLKKDEHDDSTPDQPGKVDPVFISNSHQIAEGQFSVVYYGLYRSDRSVAIKKAKKGYSDLMANELAALKAAGHHNNIVTLLGSYRQENNLCLVFEFSHHGNLAHYLSVKRPMSIITVNTPRVYQNVVPGQKVHLRSEDLWLYCNQILDAMIHLSERGIIHGDVAARNVLVFNHYHVKLSDFGLSHVAKSVDMIAARATTPLPIAWMPIEVLSHEARAFTEKTDIWSFGIYMWEVFSLGKKPYEGIPINELYSHVKTGFRPVVPDVCKDVPGNEYWYELMRSTWRENPEERPSFKQIRASLIEKNLYPK